jgi:hypothetical protein
MDLCNVQNIKTYPKKIEIMSNLLYLIAVILVICWAVGFFVYSLGSITHILLVIAAIAIVMKLIYEKEI